MSGRGHAPAADVSVSPVDPAVGPDDELLKRIAHDLGERFGIGHATIQVEHDGDDCHPASSDVV